jgi:ABC-type histidine transport system ATPase subunit
MEIFLRDISKYEGEGDVVRLEVLEGIRSCPTLVNALLRCHERFVRIVASELTVSANAAQFKNENATTVLRIGEKQVQQALKELGMVDIYNEMIHIQAVGCTPNVVDVADMSNNKKRRNKSRSKQWTKEEILEQERLLASSKEKMLLGGD